MNHRSTWRILVVLGLILGAGVARAADGTWDNEAADNNWRSTANWNPNGTPGSTTAGSFASTESATFSLAGSGTINLGDNINIKNILFGVTGGDAGAFTVGDSNDVLNLSNGGAITVNSGVTADEAIGGAGTVINLSSTSNATYSFVNNGSGTLTIGGAVTANAGASSVTTLTLDGSGNSVINQALSNAGTNGNAGLKITKAGSGTWTLKGTSLISGATTVSGGTLQLSSFAGTLQNSAITVSGGSTLGIDSSSGTVAASVTRANGVTLNNGKIVVTGTSAASTTDVAGVLTLSASTLDTITVTPNSGTVATLSLTSLTRGTAAIGFVNGLNLGVDSTATANMGRVIFSGTAPSFVGSSTDGGTATGSTKTLGVIPYLVGEFGTTGGTASGTPNTFLTYNSSTGLRPLDLVNEYSATLTASNNVRITSGTSTAGATINSLVMAGGNLALTSNMTVSSGGILFTTSNTISGTKVTMPNVEGIIIVNGGGLSAAISAPLETALATATAKAYNVYVGSGSTLTLSGGLSETGGTGSAGSFTLFGGGTLVLGGSASYSAQFGGFGYNFNINNGSVVQYTGSGGFGNTTIWNVNAGTVLDMAGSSAGGPGLTGAGTVKLTAGTMSVGSGTGYTFTGTMTGGGAFTVGGSSVAQTLSGSNNFAGGLVIQSTSPSSSNSSSILKISGGNALSDTGRVNITSNDTARTSTLDLNGASETIGSLLSSVSGTATASNTVVGNSSTASNVTLTINTAVFGNATFNGVIQNTANGAGNKTVALTKRGVNTETLTGVSTYTGGTTINNGVLLLDLSTNSTGVLASGTLTLQGGTLTVQGKNGGSASQTLGNLTLGNNGGASAIVVNNNSGTSTTLTLGNTWNRGTGTTLNIDLSSSALAVLTSNPAAALSNSVIGYATVKDTTGTGFATIDTGNIVRYASATALASNSDDATVNFSTAGAVVMTNASRAVNSLAIDTSSSAGSLDLGDPANVLSVTSKGVLMSGARNYTIRNGQLGASNTELILHQAGSGTLTIDAAVSGGTGSLVVDGGGTVQLSATNSYSGGTWLNGGVVSFSTLNNLGSGNLTFNGGTLKFAAGNTADITGRTVTFSGAGANIDTNGNNVSFASAIGAGNGGLIKTGTGNLTISALAGYTGDTTLRGGTLVLDLGTTSTGVLNAGSALLAEGGALQVRGKSSGTSSQTLGGLAARSGETVVTVNSNGGSGTTLTVNNTWVRTAGATVNFSLDATAVLQSQNVSNSNGIISGGWVTVTDATSTGFATYVDSAATVTNSIQRYTGATAYASGGTTTTATTNYSVSTNITLSAARTMNTLAVDTTSGSLAMGGAFALNTTAILMTGANDYAFNTTSVGTSGSELIVQQYGAGKLTIGGAVSGAAGSLTKGGAGTLELTGGSSYTGLTSVNRGILKVTGTGAINSTSGVLINGGTFDYGSSVALTQGVSFGTVGGTLKGSGTVANVTGGRDGTITGGDGTTGTLGISGNLTLGAGRLAVNLSKATAGSGPVAGDYNHIDVTGGSSAVDLTGGDLVVTLGTGLELNDTYYVLTNASSNAITASFEKVNGVTTDLAQGAYFNVGLLQFQISYTADAGTTQFSGAGNDIALQMTAVPEPAGLSLIGLGAATLLRRRRRN